ncbi:hypothetical protein TNCV_20901 [Trichonephila clavipes]|uniref:Uncharacterized protein n=1 Tax=Trichonephila clavipes TaxID=2585209 RepID=A0A8X6RAR3_TRICX|nr:hypothetical protein TNCV_20901 [Trichonephila clavipes]
MYSQLLTSYQKQQDSTCPGGHRIFCYKMKMIFLSSPNNYERILDLSILPINPRNEQEVVAQLFTPPPTKKVNGIISKEAIDFVDFWNCCEVSCLNRLPKEKSDHI